METTNEFSLFHKSWRFFRVVLAPKDREKLWTATVYVKASNRKRAAGEAFRKLGLLASETRVLRVEAEP